ncbi:PREDICTED: sodium/hydrogen exchanger 3-like, partial [Priapulus caudatus]|uniref:Sodium/hydrogen exchanger 3-like n=1 Tax=Priapulus caudatus TaxID=37621 RepID=A0ABM1E454_PRICU
MIREIALVVLHSACVFANTNQPGHHSEINEIGEIYENDPSTANFSFANASDHSGEKEETRYQVAGFAWHHVELPYVISLWILFASLCKTGFHLSGRLRRIIPESCMLVLLGIFVGIIIYFSSARYGQSSANQRMSSDTFFLFLLPPIVLDAGYFMPTRAFFDNIGTILLYAVVGTLFNAVSIGMSLYGLSLLNVFTVKVSFPPSVGFRVKLDNGDSVPVQMCLVEIRLFVEKIRG